MIELAKRFIDKECIISAFDSNHQFEGTIKEVSSNAILLEKDGKLYEVNGSHCSCYGLEEQWKPEEVMLSELENRLLNGTFGEDDYSGNEFKKELCEFLGVEFKLNQIYY